MDLLLRWENNTDLFIFLIYMLSSFELVPDADRLLIVDKLMTLFVQCDNFDLIFFYLTAF